MIEINKQALELTKQACHEELNKIQNKYNINQYQRIIDYLKVEYRSLSIYSFTSLCVVFGIVFFLRSVAISYMMVYFLVLGSIVMLGYVKNDLYSLNDLLGTVYINLGRDFLYRSIIVTCFQILSFIVLSLLLTEHDFVYSLLVTLIPIFISQTIALRFINYVSNSFSAIVIYLSIYLFIIIGTEVFKAYLYIDMVTVFFITTITAVIYVCNLFALYKQRKEKKYYGISH